MLLSCEFCVYIQTKRDPRGDALGFIKALFDLCKANVNDQVVQKKLVKGQVYKTEQDHYVSGGKCHLSTTLCNAAAVY